MKSSHGILAGSVLACAFIFSGCASTAPTAAFVQAIPVNGRVSDKDTVQAVVTAATGVEILDVEKTRLAQRVQERIAAKQTLNTGVHDLKSYLVELELTRYQKGNAFARAMLAGLGQIHIDGNVKLLELPERKQVGQFSIKKTFAWGGIYGSAVTMEDIERTFADGVAAAVTGQAEDKPKK